MLNLTLFKSYIKKNVFSILMSISIIFIILLVTTFFLDILDYAKKPTSPDKLKKIIVISPGTNSKNIADLLSKEGIIKYPHKFIFLILLKGYIKKIKAGEYLLSSSMSPDEILGIIVSGKVFLHKITVPEGYNINQIADLVEEERFCKGDEFLKAAQNSTLLRKMGIEYKNAEGYLFPETYYFPKEITPEKIVTTMIERFRAVITVDWIKRARELNFNLHEIVTLASIIEKETGVANERSVISSVFHNRLDCGMRLESDPTVIYCIDNYNGKITREHLTTFTPYNTYKVEGLPPCPIANPGKKSLEAALFPEKTSFLFFVSTGNGTHYFSKNIEDHNKAVQKYQLLK